MSREDLDQEALNLYSVVEVQNISGVPVAVAIDTLLLVNPRLSRQESQMIVHEAESTGEGKLRPGDFCSAVRIALKEQSSYTEDAVAALRTLVYRMRVAFRRRYLMYDAPPNHAPPYLFENSTSTTMYRSIFDTVSKGGDYINRTSFNELIEVILRDHRGLAASVMKAAVDTEEREGFIGFEEFVMVLQPATREIPLSMLLRKAENAINGIDDTHPSAAHRSVSRQSRTSESGSAARPGAWLDNLHMQADEAGDTAAAPFSRGRSHSTNIAATANLKGDMLSIRADDDEAASRTRSVINATTSKRGHVSSGTVSRGGGMFGGGNRSESTAPINATSSANVAASEPRGVEMREQLQDVDASLPPVDRVVQLEELLAKTRLENKRLKQDITHWKLEASTSSNTYVKSSMRTEMQSPQTNKKRGDANDTEELDPRHQISSLEAELRLCKARLDIQNEAVELFHLLKRSSTSETMRRQFTDENQLISKHEYIRNNADVVDRNSPQAVLLSQYELLVCAYQSLYRSLRESGVHHASAGASHGGSRSASRAASVTRAAVNGHSSVGRRRSPAPSASRSHSMASTGAGRRSPSASTTRKVAVSPFRWRDVDLPVSNELWKSGTLGDPVLTREERAVLRNKLAIQMRSAARTKSPRLKKKETNIFDKMTQDPVENEPVSSSQDAMLRLRRLSQQTSRAKNPFN